LVIWKKQTQTNPIKAKTNPIQSQSLQRAKLMQSVYLQRITKINGNGESEKTNPKQTQLPNAEAAERINFLLFFFLNLMAGYADKNVWKVSRQPI